MNHKPGFGSNGQPHRFGNGMSHGYELNSERAQGYLISGLNNIERKIFIQTELQQSEF